jgi:hypothetical protein
MLDIWTLIGHRGMFQVFFFADFNAQFDDVASMVC